MIEGNKGNSYKETVEALCPELKETTKGKPLHAKRLPFLRNVITIGFEMDGALTFEEATERSREVPLVEVLRIAATVDKNDVANMQYTSGTTGFPKGVMLTDANYMQAMKIHDIRLTNVNNSQSTLCFLPLSHVFERAWTYYSLHKGITVYINSNPKEVQSVLKEVRPNLMCAVPRFWEKVYAGVNEKIDSFPGVLQSIARHAIAIGKKRNIDYVRNDKKVPTLLEWRYQFYNKTLFHVLRKAIGIDRGVMFPCAGSQLADEVNILLHSVGVNIVVGYGLTETTATVSCCNPYSKGYDIESAGEPMPEVEIKLGENDEILLRGKTIPQGYYNKPQANEEAFIDGWFRTGDAGRILPNGRLVIVERIKELFKTSNGKYIAPQQVENKLVVDKYIEQVAIIGDLRKFVSALIVPAYDALKEYATEQGITYSSMSELLKDKKIYAFYEERINHLLSDLAAYERVKRFTLLENPFTPNNEELTLTLKLKRKVINQHYAEVIEAMYQD